VDGFIFVVFYRLENRMQQPSTYRYSRAEMREMRELVLSRTRPSLLSEEFDNDDGLFSPDKWLQVWSIKSIT
jgi:hypothetical protein